MNNFELWLNSDNVVKTGKGYKTQCTLYRKLFSLAEFKVYYKKEYKTN